MRGTILRSPVVREIGRAGVELWMANQRNRRSRGEPPEPLSPEIVAYEEAKKLANRRVRFFGHFTVWGMVFLFLLFTAGFRAATIVALSWGIGLACHGYYSVIAPALRRRWIQEEVQVRLQHSVQSSVRAERETLQGRHQRSVAELSASVAHEIRNPITAAKSLVQQMGEDPGSPENVEYARVALEELDRVERSIANLLRFAREEDMKVEDVEMSDVIESALDTFRDRLARSGVKIERSADDRGAMRGDPEKLRRVVINLVSNAMDALDETMTRDPRIKLSWGRNLAGSEVWLRVADNGPGIAPDQIAKIWSPFHTTKVNGTGLGLAICKKNVEQHGGTIEVISKEGQGTEFVVTFPRGEAAAQRAESVL